MSKYRDDPYVIRIEESRKLQPSGALVVHPETPKTAATPQAFAAVKTHIRHPKRYERRVLEIDSYPVTPEPTAGDYPGSGAVRSFRTSFKFSLQQLPYPDEYPVASPPAAEPFGAYNVTTVRKWPEVAQYLQTTSAATVFKKTDPAIRTGWYPAGQAAEKAHKVWFDRKRIGPLVVVETPATPKAAAVPPSYFPPKQHVRRGKLKLLKLPQLDQFTETPAVNPEAYAPVLLIRRKPKARILRFPERLDAHPTTATTAAVPPSYFAPTTHRRHGKAQIIYLPDLFERPETIVTAKATRIRLSFDHRNIELKGETGQTSIFMDTSRINIKRA